MRIVFDDIKESLAPNFKGGEKSFASRAYSDGKNKMMKGRLVPGLLSVCTDMRATAR